MDQHQINVIHIQIWKCVIYDAAGVFIIPTVDFAGDKDFFPGDDFFIDCFLKTSSNADFIPIVPCRIDKTHSALQGMVHGILRFVIGESPCPEADDGHLPAAV